MAADSHISSVLLPTILIKYTFSHVHMLLKQTSQVASKLEVNRSLWMMITLRWKLTILWSTRLSSEVIIPRHTNKWKS